MIAAQLLAYYFTELKDDQVKKVSVNSSSIKQIDFFPPTWGPGAMWHHRSLRVCVGGLRLGRCALPHVPLSPDVTSEAE